MDEVWQVQEAKNRFSELLERAATQGPQVITRHGRPVAQVVAMDGGTPCLPGQDDGFLDFVLNAPKSGLPEGLPPIPRSVRSRKPLFGDS